MICVARFLENDLYNSSGCHRASVVNVFIECQKRIKRKKLENLLKLLQLNNGDTSKFTQEQKKAMKDHKFWRTQPVKDFDEKVVEEGPIDKPKTPEDISDKPLPLLSSFEWCSIDVDNKKTA